MSLDRMLDEYRASPEFREDLRREGRATLLTGWMKHIPIVGHLTHTFWYCLIDEGVSSTCKPRWGALTFSFLNDGMGAPTLWHTWRSVVAPTSDDANLWVDGAPTSRADADAKRAVYAKRDAA